MIKFDFQEELNNLENIKTCLDDEQEDNKFADMFQFNSQLTDRPNDEDTNEGFEFRDILVKKNKKKKKDEKIKEEIGEELENEELEDKEK